MLNYSNAYALAEAAMNGEARVELSRRERGLVLNYREINEIDDYAFVAYDTDDFTFLIGDDGDFYLISTDTNRVYYVEAEGFAEVSDEMIAEVFC